MKESLRREFSLLRDRLSKERQKEASLALTSFLMKKLLPFGHIASFASKGSEINLWDLNVHLCSEGRLVLPKREDFHLTLFYVKDIERDLKLGAFGIMEPDPALCKKAETDAIDALLVPGLVFDKKNHRLGYGKGLYDKLLVSLEEHLKIGVCFKEQLIDLLPKEDHDEPVDIIYSF